LWLKGEGILDANATGNNNSKGQQQVLRLRRRMTTKKQMQIHDKEKQMQMRGKDNGKNRGEMLGLSTTQRTIKLCAATVEMFAVEGGRRSSFSTPTSKSARWGPGSDDAHISKSRYGHPVLCWLGTIGSVEMFA